ncbi:MAG: DUF4153 domain-containing protein, partial [Blastocatellia bacterium]
MNDPAVINMETTSGVADPNEAWRSTIAPPDLPDEVLSRTSGAGPRDEARARAATRRALALLALALIAGVTGDQLLRFTPWGLNVFLWIGAVTGGALLLTRRDPGFTRYGNSAWLLAPLLFFAGCFAWRDSPTLRMLDSLAIFAIIVMLGFSSRRGTLVYAGVTQYLRTGLALCGAALTGIFRLLGRDLAWGFLWRGAMPGHLESVMRGILISIPLLALFGMLLVSADAAFENLLARVFSFDLPQISGHVLMTGLLTAICGGALRYLLIPIAAPEVEAKGGRTLGMIEIGMTMGLLNLLFQAFVMVQFRYFFFAEMGFTRGSGYSYAVYARRGFFELVWVAALSLTLMLTLHWLLKKDDPRHEMVFRLLSGWQIALLSVMLVSAIKRMRLYQACCGLTELRLYTTVFMAWLAVVLVWFIATVLRGRRARFAYGAAVSGLAVIAFLHLLN